MLTQLPRIPSPHLGCPIIVSPEDLKTKGLDIVMAEEDGPSADRFSLLAHPAYSGEGRKFALDLTSREGLSEGTLLSTFERIEETRFLISTTLRSWIFAGKARFFRYQAKITSPFWMRDCAESPINPGLPSTICSSQKTGRLSVPPSMAYVFVPWKST